EQHSARASACIFLFLNGGASHIDMWDMKPDAPVEVRGEFQPIATSVPSLHLTEHLPRTAQLAQHLAFVRSVQMPGGENSHGWGVYSMLTGQPADRSRWVGVQLGPRAGHWPFLGCVVAAKHSAARRSRSSRGVVIDDDNQRGSPQLPAAV